MIGRQVGSGTRTRRRAPDDPSGWRIRAYLLKEMEQRSNPVSIPVNGERLQGILSVPPDAKGLVIFAHGSGSSRFSPRNQYVASILQGAGLGTLLLDLLSEEEEAEDLVTTEHRFNIRLLGERVAAAADWIFAVPKLSSLPVGYFGSSTGAAAALVASAARPRVKAVVSRGGRPDLAGDALARVRAPTLFLVGGRDQVVLELNRDAMARIPGHVRLSVIPGAGHLFEEPGALEEVARDAASWFAHYLPLQGGLPLEF